MRLLLLSSCMLSTVLLIEGTFLPIKEHNQSETHDDHQERNGRSFLASLGYGTERTDRNRIVVLLLSQDQLHNVNPTPSDQGLDSIPVNGWLVPSTSNPDVFNLVLDSNVETRRPIERKPQPQLLWRFDGNQPQTGRYAEQEASMLRINPGFSSAQYEIVPAPAAPSNFILTPTAQNNKRPAAPQAQVPPVASPPASSSFQPPPPPHSPPAPTFQPSSPPSSYPQSSPSFSPPLQSFSPPPTPFSPLPQKPASTFGTNNPFLQQAFAQQQKPVNQPAQLAQPPYVPPAPSPPIQSVPVQPSYVASHPISSPPPPPPPTQNLSETVQAAASPPVDQASHGSNHPPAPSQHEHTTTTITNSTIEDDTIGSNAAHTPSSQGIHQSNQPILSQVPPPPPSTPQQPTAGSSTYIATISYGPDRPSLVFNCTKTDLLTQAELGSGSFVEGPYGYACSLSQGSPLPSTGGQIVGVTGHTKDAEPASLSITVPVAIAATDLARPEKIRLRPQSNLIGVTS
ncbi:Hypothetical protein NTJ_04705 [Nesidiocoris tenuis]|uniref:Uncharacterized protein n=1 Tax=Nesidiocoris tenuis TaxID=355587 RepID=A0ABN7ANE1_9HEMI|nr:Hypothetical protein NTJ_04705 [Nesidiocoris tenuis]